MHKLGTKADTLEALYKNIERFSMWGRLSENSDDLKKVKVGMLL